LIQITKLADVQSAGAGNADAAARAALARFGKWKLRLIRVIEALALPIVSVLDRLNPAPSSEVSDENVHHILVVEYWHLGDLVMQMPFLQNLRLQYPAARIVLLASPKAAPLLAGHKVVDEIILISVPWAQHYERLKKYNPFSAHWLALFRTLNVLKARRFDLAFASRADLRDNFMLWFIKARRRVGYSYGGGGLFLTDKVIPDLKNPHQAQRSLRLLEHLQKPILERHPRLYLSPDEDRHAEKFLADRGIRRGDTLVGVHPGARSLIRQWGEGNFVDVVQRLSDRFPVKVLWFQEAGKTPPLPPDERFVSLSLPLREFMAVLNKCDLLICNDSGPMHIATSLNVPVVAVFGPGEPAWFGPLGSDNEIVIRSGFWCRPCLDYCLFDQPYCLRTISVDEVYKAAEKSIQNLLTKPNEEAQPAAPFRKTAAIQIV
jgi:heptosyltransferase II